MKLNRAANFATGSPGIGIFIQGASGVNYDYEFMSYTATDGLPDPPPPNLAITGPQTGGTFVLQLNGISGTTYLIQHAPNLITSNWQSPGSVLADGSGLARFTNVPPSGVSQRFYRAVWP